MRSGMADAEKYRYATSAPDVVSNAVHVINLAGGLDVPELAESRERSRYINLRLAIRESFAPVRRAVLEGGGPRRGGFD
jgi:hypothetical protein